MFFFRFNDLDYSAVRKTYLTHYEQIIECEKNNFDVLLNGLGQHYLEIEKEFNLASHLSDYWKRYAPRQRGRGALNESYPWGEVGEKVLDAFMYQIVCENYPSHRFVGLPYGHDIRFVTDEAFIHLDIKSTGPHDSLDEVVSSPNQVSGDGLLLDNEGVYNSPVHVQGPRRDFVFQPELPPFYIIDGRPRITLTYYLKCAYDVISMGEQPLLYLELISVPNGLLMFDSVCYCEHSGLLIPGKDTLDSVHKRTRIRLLPLAEIDKWRCVKLFNSGGKIKQGYRLE